MRIQAIFAMLTVPAVCVAASYPAPSAPVHQASHPQHHRSAKPAAVLPAAYTPPAPPAAPKPPDWPVNNPPSPAAVVWDSQGLRIQAENSSLSQILKQVCTDTGATVEGLNKDERIFGTYGPGPARDVLAQLLDGTGYNVLLSGGQSEATPLQVELSARPTGPAPPVSPSSENAENDTYQDQQEQQPPPPQQPVPPERFGGNPSQQPRTPQQIMQELLQRQQQMQQNQPGQQPQ